MLVIPQKSRVPSAKNAPNALGLKKHNMKFGLIGHPIAHSLSPALFKAGYDGRYPYELIETADFEEAYERFLEGYDGINVTAPFKELAFAKADILSPECKTIGATNLLVKTPEGIKAYNSDYLGVRMWLAEKLRNLGWKEMASAEPFDVLSACEKRATPLAAGGGTHSIGVGGVLFKPSATSAEIQGTDCRPWRGRKGCCGSS